MMTCTEDWQSLNSDIAATKSKSVLCSPSWLDHPQDILCLLLSLSKLLGKLGPMHELGNFALSTALAMLFVLGMILAENEEYILPEWRPLVRSTVAVLTKKLFSKRVFRGIMLGAIYQARTRVWILPCGIRFSSFYSSAMVTVMGTLNVTLPRETGYLEKDLRTGSSELPAG
jgi:hypothetical protein